MTMEIRVIGPGCSRCVTLADHTSEAVQHLGIEANVEQIHDPMQIAALGILTTPALVVDGALVMAGQVPTVAQLEDLFAARA